MEIPRGCRQSHQERTRTRTTYDDRGTQGRSSYAVGVVLLLVVVLLWTASGFITQILYRDGYDKPFLVTYTSTSVFALYLVPQFVPQLWGKRSTKDYRPLASEPQDTLDDEEPMISAPLRPPSPEEKTAEVGFLSVQETVKLACSFCWLWFIANWAINTALNYTSVASSTIVASTSGFLTLGLGHIFGVERFTLSKIAAVLICFSGVVLVSLSDSRPVALPSSESTTLGGTLALDTSLNQSSQPFFGDFLALISAIFYALYVILLKVKVKNESQIDMRLFLGFVGFFNLVTCWPVGLILHWAGIEELGLPATRRQYVALLANTAILVFSDYLYVLAMLKTTPLLVTIGISLSIPIAVLGDFILNSPVRGEVLLGAFLVLLSFVVIGWDTLNGTNDRRRGEDSVSLES